MARWFFLAGFCLYGGALALRHAWFQTSAWDLAIFVQALALIGRGLPAESSLLGFHILGDHGALVLYPLAALSRLLPLSLPALLIGLQSAALAGAVFPLRRLAGLRGLSPRATAVSLAVLLLYPVVFNTAIFDFHPEVLAFPLVVEALHRIERAGPHDQRRALLCLLLALTCKLALALLVLGFGVWLLGRGRRRLGGVLLAAAAAWLLLVGGVLIPAFGGARAGVLRHAGKFGLEAGPAAAGGPGPLEALRVLLGHLLSLESLAYLALLLLPVAYVLAHRQRRRFLAGLLPFAPLLLLNLLSASPALKDLVHHYSLFLVPFLVAGVQQSFAPGPGGREGYPRWLRPRLLSVVLAWALIAFLLFSRLSFFASSFRDRLDNAPQLRQAMALVRPETALLTANQIAPHLAERPVLAITTPAEAERLSRYEQILLDRRHPGWQSSPELVQGMIASLRADPCLQLRFEAGDVLLFERDPACPNPRAPVSR